MVGTDFSYEDESIKNHKLNPPKSHEAANTIKKFVLYRFVDVSGISGEGPVAVGVQFNGKKCVLNWLNSRVNVDSLAFYDSIQDLEKVHGHDGRTVVIFTE